MQDRDYARERLKRKTAKEAHLCGRCGHLFRRGDMRVFGPKVTGGTQVFQCKPCAEKFIAEFNRSQEQAPAIDRRYRRSYGIGLNDYGSLYIAQNGVCAICRTRPDPDKPLVVDHDHGSGAVRGLLCSTCNSGIGMLKDNVTTLASAIIYLSKSQDFS